ncbi:MAG: translation initiation factor IF-2 subunit gamma [Methanosarcinales archaeon]
MEQPTVNIGIIGHVDHGKTTLVSALSGIWTDKHSEEIKRGISIRLGYADATFRKCPDCPDPEAYTVTKECEHCGAQTETLRTVSFVDSPGHETLMATMLSGAAIMNGAVLVIAANEPCPQPQTKEHLMALDIIGIKNIVIIQNKIDLVNRDAVIENYHQIQDFIKGTIAQGAPIIPVSAQQSVNMDILIKTIEEFIHTPEQILDKPAIMLLARSFDVNRPGAKPGMIKGGILGGTISVGILRPNDEIEIRPGRRIESGGIVSWEPIQTVITNIMSGSETIKEATPGGLIGVGTKLDPSVTKSDSLVGQVAGEQKALPKTRENFIMDVRLLERVVGSADELVIESIHSNEVLMLNIGTATTVGIVTSARKNEVEIKLKRPVCADPGDRVAISRRVGARWRLIGSGIIKK